MSGVLLDTCVLIDYLRDMPAAVRYMEQATGGMSISGLTVAELHAGARDDEERASLREFVAAFDVVPADLAICEKGGAFRAEYGASHGLDLIDGVIAATAVLRGLPLVTMNRKHFPMIENLIVPYRRQS